MHLQQTALCCHQQLELTFTVPAVFLEQAHQHQVYPLQQQHLPLQQLSVPAGLQ
jgi:hypothetical protein